MRTIFQIILLVALSLNCRAQIVPILRNVFTTNDFDKAILGGAIPYFDYPSGKFVGSPTAYVNAILYDPTLGFLSIIHTNDTGDLLLQLGVSSSSGPSIQAYADKLVVANTNLTFDAVGPFSIRLRVNSSNSLEAVAGGASFSGKTNLVADNGSVLTYNGVPIGGTVTNSAILQSFYYGGQYGFDANSIMPTNIRSSNLSSGTNDLFTVPAGKHFILSASNVSTTNTSTICYLMLKTNGIYYRYSTSAAITTNSISQLTTSGDNFFFEAGETVAINTAAVGVNSKISGLLFPTNGFVYSPRVMSLSAGTNLIYQCPAGKCAVNLPIPNPSFVGHAAIVATYMNDSGTSRSVTGYVVSSGAVPDTSNREFLNRSVTDDNQTFLFGGIMFPGDYIVFSTDASTATQWIRLTVAEIPFP